MIPEEYRAWIFETLAETVAEPFSEQITSLSQLSIIWELHEPGDTEEVTSRLGGLPDVPEDWCWPIGPEGPLKFIGQVVLTELEACGFERRLPASGVLSFFFGPDLYGASSADDYRIAKVFYFDGNNLVRAHAPAGTELHSPVEMVPHVCLDLPYNTSNLVASEFYQQLTSEERDEVSSLLLDLSFGSRGAFKLLGLASREQRGALELECEAFTLGLNYSSMKGKEAMLRQSAGQWQLLAQISLDWIHVWPDNTDGYLHFWIRRSDLEQADFSRIAYTWERS